ncbi:MAG: acyl-ACP--UDP-N-acetylglucosamine O-acyltransferase [Acidobacteriota bacterium]|nr:acyl-ACP--UDP-N-acetylglucosamine O-acyltransferase [Acidobacteriota bacterium]
MAGVVHATAVVDPSARLSDGVVVGPHAFIGPDVEVGRDTEIGAGAQIARSTRMGAENKVYGNACIGFDPQDLKYGGEETVLEVGDRNHFREFCTVHRGTGLGGGKTTIGDGNLFMAYSHVAHDCNVGDHTVFANAGTLAGHVEVGDGATVGAFTAVHQFCRVGRRAYIGGYSVITKDALPFMKTVGIKPVCLGLNTIGLQRAGVSEESIARLDAAARILLRGGLNTGQALDRIETEAGDSAEVADLIAFIRSSERGVITRLPGRRGGRGGE